MSLWWTIIKLIIKLKWGETSQKVNAALSLGRSGKRSAVNALAAALKDKDEYVRKAAARALGESKDARAVKPLIAALEDKHPHVRSIAAEALEAWGWRPTAGKQRALFAISRQQWDDAVKEKAEAVEPLIAALKGDDYDVRGAAAKALTRLQWRAG